MGRFSRIGVTASAGGLVAVGVVAFGGCSQGSPQPAATDSGHPTTSAIASPFPGSVGSTNELAAGRYATGDPFLVPASVTVPAGWKSEVGGPYALFLSSADGFGNSGPATLVLVLSPVVYSDACQGSPASAPAASVGDFVTAVAALQGVTVSEPKDVSLGGLQGVQLTVTPPANGAGCQSERVMTLPLGHDFGVQDGDTMTLTAVDVSGSLLVVEEKTTGSATAQDRDELDGVLTSMSIGG